MDFEPTTPAGKPANRVSDRIQRELRRKIITLELRPGTVINEIELAEQLGCSRTPIREALQRLAQEHLVTIMPRRAVVVADLSIIDLSALLEAVLGIETLLVRLAAERLDDQDLAALEAIVVQSEAAGQANDFATVVELDFDFHHRIALAANNHYLAEAAARLSRLLIRFSYLGLKRAGTAVGALGDHRRVLAALCRRDPEASVRCMQEHWNNGRERMRAAL